MVMDINEIREYLPHRYPFLLVDRVTQLAIGESIVGYKNVSINEPFFNGHFPHHPIMPGVLVLEALAQVVPLGLELFHDVVNIGIIQLLQLGFEFVQLTPCVVPIFLNLLEVG